MFKSLSLLLIVAAILSLNGCSSKNKYRRGFEPDKNNKYIHEDTGTKYNPEGYDYIGRDKEGYKKDGYNLDGFNRAGYNKVGYKKDGFTADGYDSGGYNKNGMSKKGAKKSERLLNVINSKLSIDKVFQAILTGQTKDKYESTNEYLIRMKDMKLNDYAVMTIEPKGIYDPDKKVYQWSINLLLDILSSRRVKKYKEGDPSLIVNLYKESNAFKEKIKFSEYGAQSNYKEMMSNAYGHSVEVTHFNSISYKAYFDNLLKIELYTPDTFKVKYDKYRRKYSKEANVIIMIPSNKERAKKLDNQKFKIKIGLEINRTKLYKYDYSSTATISNPVSIVGTDYIFEAHIKEFILYNKSSKEIIYSYTN